MSHTHTSAFSGSVARLCREGLSPVVFSPEVAAEPEIPGNRTLLGSFPGESPRGWGASDGGGSPVGQTRTRAPGGAALPRGSRRRVRVRCPGCPGRGVPRERCARSALCPGTAPRPPARSVSLPAAQLPHVFFRAHLGSWGHTACIPSRNVKTGLVLVELYLPAGFD